MISPSCLRGCHVALITPMVRRGKLMVMDHDLLFKQIARCVDAGVAGVLFAGTTGQSATLTHDEQVELVTRGIEFARERARAAGRTIVCLASAGSNSTAEALSMSVRIADAVAPDALLHVTGYYNNPPQEGLRAHFEAIADEMAPRGVGIILYNIPGRTASRIEPATMVRLAQHPAIVAVKDANGDLESLRRIRAETDPGTFALLSGEDHLVADIIRLGGVGVISASANRWPGEFQRLAELALAGEIEAADALQAALLPCIEAVFAVKNPIPLHHMLGAGLRLPLVQVAELDEANRRRVLDKIARAESIADFPHVGLAAGAHP
ncbi:MAG: 4-hydroxy-tetrahydrodipicolinate synthase [Candidatus Sumerlaeia bacterium]|nr:4-hydroxy-tetrahydrodipicolinate synthase [Candidatus Sumerlaeia bacterium]